MKEQGKSREKTGPKEAEKEYSTIVEQQVKK